MTDAAPLAEFLLARIAEDEAAAKWALSTPVYGHFGDTAAAEVVELGVNEGGSELAEPHFALQNPPRVLLKCAAWRRIVEFHSRTVEHNPEPTDYECSGAVNTYQDPNACRTLRALASVYADHPDYRPDWA